MEIMENEEVENKKAVNKQALFELSNSAEEYANRYFNSTPKAQIVELGKYREDLIKNHQFTEEEADYLCTHLLSMGVVAERAKERTKKEIKANYKTAKRALDDFTRTARYDEGLYESAKPENKVKWRFTDAVEDRFRLFDYNCRRSANGLGIALDKIILGAEKAGFSASLGTKKFVRAASETLRGAKNGFVAACYNFGSKLSTGVKGFLQNRGMKHNLRVDHNDAIATSYYEKETKAKLQEALSKTNFDKAERERLETLNEMVETYTTDKHLKNSRDNMLRYANMYLEGYPEVAGIEDIRNGFVKFDFLHKKEATKAEQIKTDYFNKKSARNNDAKRKWNEDEKRNSLTAKKVGSQVYHARKAELNRQVLDTSNLKAANERSEFNKTEVANEYQRIVDRTVAVKPNIIKRAYNRLKVFVWGIPSDEREIEGTPDGRKMADENSRKASEMESISEKPVKKGIRGRIAAWRVSRAEKKAVEATNMANYAEENGNTERAAKMKERAEKYTKKAQQISDNYAKKVASRGGKDTATDTVAPIAPIAPATSETSVEKPVEKKQGFWARRAARRAEKAQIKAQAATKAAEEAEKNGDVKRAEKLKNKATKLENKAQRINDKQAKKTAPEGAATGTVIAGTTEASAEKPADKPVEKKLGFWARRREYRKAKKAKKQQLKKEIREAKAERNKTVGEARKTYKDRVRAAKMTYKQAIASLKNAIFGKPIKATSADEAKKPTTKKPSLWTRFRNYFRPVPIVTAEQTDDEEKGKTAGGMLKMTVNNEPVEEPKKDSEGEATNGQEGAANAGEGSNGADNNPVEEANAEQASATNAGEGSNGADNNPEDEATETQDEQPAVDQVVEQQPVKEMIGPADEPKKTVEEPVENPEATDEPAVDKPAEQNQVKEMIGPADDEPKKDSEGEAIDEPAVDKPTEQKTEKEMIGPDEERDAEIAKEKAVQKQVSEITETIEEPLIIAPVKEPKKDDETIEENDNKPVEQKPVREMIGPDRDKEFNDYKNAQEELGKKCRTVIEYFDENGNSIQVSVVGQGMRNVGELAEKCVEFNQVAQKFIEREQKENAKHEAVQKKVEQFTKANAEAEKPEVEQTRA